MARPIGSRNSDYSEARLALARRVRARLLTDGGLRTSLRELAQAADTSVATLKHYFHDRSGLMQGVLQAMRVDASPHLARASIPIEGNVRQSLLALLQEVHQAWERFGLGQVQALGLAAGLSDGKVGPSYVTYLLEPTLQTAEARLTRHIELGELKLTDVRAAALQLMAPVVMALLHQVNLSGVTCRPLDVGAFIELHVDDFLRAHPPSKRKA